MPTQKGMQGSKYARLFATTRKNYRVLCTNNITQNIYEYRYDAIDYTICTFFFFFSHFYFSASGQAVVTGVVPSSPGSCLQLLSRIGFSISHCSSIFHRVLLTHALALSASQFVNKKKSPRIYTSMHSGGFELTKLIYTRLQDNLMRHRGDRTYGIMYVYVET